MLKEAIQQPINFLYRGNQSGPRNVLHGTYQWSSNKPQDLTLAIIVIFGVSACCTIIIYTGQYIDFANILRQCILKELRPHAFLDCFCIVCSEVRINQLKTPTHTTTTIFIMAAYFVHVWIAKEFLCLFSWKSRLPGLQ